MNSVPVIDFYPWRKILPRWIFGIIEIILSVYFVIRFNQNLALFYSAWWAVSLFVILPLVRCCHCYYYGKRCNTGWGLWAGFAFNRGETRFFQSGYGLTVLLWPLRILPLLFGIKDLVGAIGESLQFNPNGLFGIYVLAILLHRWFYRTANCPSCHQKSTCPVYNPRILGNQTEPDTHSSPDTY
jgi:hypothetical protein